MQKFIHMIQRKVLYKVYHNVLPTGSNACLCSRAPVRCGRVGLRRFSECWAHIAVVIMRSLPFHVISSEERSWQSLFPRKNAIRCKAYRERDCRWQSIMDDSISW